MTDYDNYDENLAFEPIGDWADTEPKVNTDRTQSSLDLVDKIAELTKWLDLKSEYIVKLEDENKRLKELLKECRSVIHGAFLVCSKEMCDKIDEVLK